MRNFLKTLLIFHPLTEYQAMVQEADCVGSWTGFLVTSLVHTPTHHQLNGVLVNIMGSAKIKCYIKPSKNVVLIVV